MQFAGALPNQLYFFRVNAADQLIQQRTRGRALILKVGFAPEYPLIIATHRVHTARPNVAFIGWRRMIASNNCERNVASQTASNKTAPLPPPNRAIIACGALWETERATSPEPIFTGIAYVSVGASR